MKLATNVVKGKMLRDAQLRALKLFAETISATYGPMGGYTAYSYQDTSGANKLKPLFSNYTKDGLQVMKRIDTDKPIESLLREEIITICINVVKKVGDGTTSATILSYLIFKGLLDLLNSKKYTKREIISEFIQVLKEGSEMIQQNPKECTLDDIYNIAKTSTDCNIFLAETIRDIYKESGMDVFIDVQASNNEETVVKTYDGMIYEAGYIDPAFANTTTSNKNETPKCELNNANVYVFESPIDTPEMINIVKLIIDRDIESKNKLAQEQYNAGKKITSFPTPVLIISPTISRDANSYIDNLIIAFTNVSADQRPPLCLVTNLDNDNQYLTDIMKMTGGRFIKKYIDPATYKMDKENNLAINETGSNLGFFAGHAEKVIVDGSSTRIIGPENMYNKDGSHSIFFNEYINQLEAELALMEETRQELVKIGKLKRRISLLKGNMVDLYVGGIGETSDRMVLMDSVEDAVLNCRSAAKDGVGRGANYEGLSTFFKLANMYHQELDNLADGTERPYSEIKSAMLRVEIGDLVSSAYLDLVSKIYEPYFEDEDKAKSFVLLTLTSVQEDNEYSMRLAKLFDPKLIEQLKQNTKIVPFNIISESFDNTVLTSIATEPSILRSIEKIVTLLFNTTQFLLPDARFNIYEMEEGTMVVDATDTKELDKKLEEYKPIFEEQEDKPTEQDINEFLKK